MVMHGKGTDCLTMPRGSAVVKCQVTECHESGFDMLLVIELCNQDVRVLYFYFTILNSEFR